jgi:hypothetical protein
MSGREVGAGRAVRADWRDAVAVAADVALLGVVLAVAAAPVLTAGAAVATASAAVHHFFEYGRWPAASASWAVFRRSLVPGCAAVLVAGGAAALLAVDLAALRAGLVPGGPALVVVTAALSVAGVGYAGLVVVEVGRGAGWRAAARGALVVAARPALLAASAGVVCLAAALAAMVHPVLAPVLAGYAVYALHAVHRRLAPIDPSR